ncbi:flagellar biosynthetic protein FliO [Tahibacter soli]|uniref:Flagellar protein n=1 Tax=Tahibacter soli TaxID=2983605 RepID=A0A9X3YJS6_9GAMM|nr:flagellar biosynthetic protein FliO [Tahibacter soli]MDC8012872.1 flagellar biosynthetic protein FliO [Tahibacter soli]
MSAAAPLAAAAPSLAGSVGSFVFVIALIVGLAWIARRLARAGVRRDAPMRVRATLPLGAKERLVLVEAAGEHLLLAIGANGVHCVHRYDAAPLLPVAPEPAAPAFAEQLLRSLGAQSRA